jgi:predicted dehydrogenase
MGAAKLCENLWNLVDMETRIAFFGTGELARPYLRALSKRTDVRVVGVCDPDPRTAAEAASGWAAKVYPHFEPMLKETSPDALWVCVPPRMQSDVLRLAADLRIPFFVEPPGAANFDAAREIQRKVEAAKLPTAVGYSARYVDVIREAKEYLGINAVPLAMGWWLSGPADGVANAAELLWSDACRLIDLLRFFCGNISAVNAVASGTDALALQMRMEKGTIATIAVAAHVMAEPRVELELLGEGWYFRFQEALTVLRLAERDKTTIVRQMNAPHAEHVAAFLDAVRTRKELAVGYADAVETVRVLEAVRSNSAQ